METQNKTPNSQSNLEKKNRAREIKLPDYKLQTTLQNYSHQDIVLAQKQKYRPIEQDGKLSAPISILSLTKEAKTCNGEKTVFNKWCRENCSTTWKRIN